MPWMLTHPSSRTSRQCLGGAKECQHHRCEYRLEYRCEFRCEYRCDNTMSGSTTACSSCHTANALSQGQVVKYLKKPLKASPQKWSGNIHPHSTGQEPIAHMYLTAVLSAFSWSYAGERPVLPLCLTPMSTTVHISRP